MTKTRQKVIILQFPETGEGVETMRTFENDLIIRKEGKLYTLYLGDVSLGCGNIDDLTDWIANIAERLEAGESAESITKDFNTFY